MEETVVLVCDFSEESEKAQRLLEQNKIKYMQILFGSKDGSPTLITSRSAFSYRGVNEIEEYLDLLPAV